MGSWYQVLTRMDQSGGNHLRIQVSDNRKKTRKYHHKTRTGCFACREKHLKCDEGKPACQRCVRAGIECKRSNLPDGRLGKGIRQQLLRPSNVIVAGPFRQNTPSKDEPFQQTHLRPLFYPGSPALQDLRRSYASTAGLSVTLLDSLLDYTFSVFGPTMMWRFHTTKEERQSFCTMFVQCLLQQPSLVEAVFSMVVTQMPYQSWTARESRHRSLLHYGRALTMFRERITKPDAAMDDATFWTIISFLIMQQEKEDWPSFRTNLSGLQQIVSIRGGAEALDSQIPRARNFFNWATRCMEEQQLPRSDLHLSSNLQGEIQLSELSLADGCLSIPVKIDRLRGMGFISSRTTALVSYTICWFTAHIKTPYTSLEQNSTSGRAELARHLDHHLLNHCALQHDFLISTALLSIVITHPPSTLRQTHPETLRHHLASTWATIDGAVDQASLLWLALGTASMPVGFGVSSSMRWKMLERYIMQAPARMTWEQARKVVDGFWEPSFFDDLWPGCWRVACMRVENSKSIRQNA